MRNRRRILQLFFILLVAPCYAATVTLSIPSLTASPGDTDVRVPVNISDVTGLGIITAQMVVNYDADIVVATSVEAGTVVPDDTNLTVDIENHNGRVQITLAGTDHFAGQGELVYILMDVVSEDRDAHTELTLSDVELNDAGDFNIQIVNGDVALPVQLASFQAVIGPDGVVLNWRTVLEIANLGFHVYRSEDGLTPYTRISGKLIPGNAACHDYRFVDTDIRVGQTYHYLLENVDMHGEATRSHTIEITYDPQRLRTLSTTWGYLKRHTGR